jgi:hypothetical protein
VFGTRASDGFGARAYDNVGVQYGLDPLLKGLITPTQFADLNSKIGGLTIDYGFSPARTPADPGTVATAYRANRVTDAHALARVPIMDLRGADNYEIHTDFRSYAMRSRLQSANGTAGNQVIFTATTPLVIPAAVTQQSALLLDQWLTGIESDTSGASRPAKVLAHKPAGAVDACFVNGTEITDATTCHTALPYFGDPRIGAGGPLADNNLKCQLKPLVKSDYPTVTFLDSDWALLQQAFPNGVCDWTKPSQGFQRGLTWMSYAGGVGGNPLGVAPESRALVRSATAPATGQLPNTSPALPAATAAALLAVAALLAGGRRRRRCTAPRSRQHEH